MASRLLGPFQHCTHAVPADPWEGSSPPPSCSSIALLLGGHLVLSEKEKIWRGKYVDVFSLLHTEPEPVLQVRDVQKDQEQLKKCKIDRNFTNWLYEYSIYMMVVLQMHPQKALALIKYIDLIHLRSAHDLSLDWRVPQWELWVQLVILARATGSDSGHIIVENVAPVPKPTAPNTTSQAGRACYKFNSTGKCAKSNCFFAHACVLCGNKHAVSACPKLSSFRGSRIKGGGKKGGTVSRVLVLERGPTPIRLPVLLALLGNFSNREAAQFLASGFSLGFRILIPPPVLPTQSCNLRSVLGMEEVVRAKILKV